MSELRVRVHLRNGSTHEVVRQLPDRPRSGGESEQAATTWRGNQAATLMEEIGVKGTWTDDERWFIPPHAVDAVEFMSGPTPAKATGERDDDYYNPDKWASVRR